MKLIVLLVLAGIGVCYGFNGNDPPSDQSPEGDFQCDSSCKAGYAASRDCVKLAMETNVNFLEAGVNLLCKHLRKEMYKKEEYYAAFKKSLSNFMRSTGCGTLGVFGFSELGGEVGAQAGYLTGEAVRFIGEIIHGLSMSGPMLDTVCLVTSAILPKECTDKLTYSALEFAHSLQGLSCQARAKSMNLPVTVRLLKSIGCFGDNLLGLGNELENFTGIGGVLVTNALRGLVGGVLGVPAVGHIVGHAVCVVNGALSLFGSGKPLGILG